jgi:hypothetical protein
LNDQVFRNQTVGYIGSFDDVIDSRLFSMTTLSYDTTLATVAMGEREFWSAQWDLERTSATNGMTDTIDDDASNVVLSIANGVFSIVGDAVSATGTLPITDETFTLAFESSATGNVLTVNGASVDLTYTLGDAETTQAIGGINSRVISALSGFFLLRVSFNSAGALINNFLLNEESLKTGETAILLDEVNAYEMTGVPDPLVWKTVYIEPSSGLDSQYRSPLDMGLDYHLQDGGEWAIEPESERERKWYTRGIPMARNILSNNTTYKGPLGIS